MKKDNRVLKVMTKHNLIWKLSLGYGFTLVRIKILFYLLLLDDVDKTSKPVGELEANIFLQHFFLFSVLTCISLPFDLESLL